MSKIVVFGAGGFIGQHLVRALAAANTNEIVAFDRFSKYKDTNTKPFSEFPNVTAISGDFLNREEIATVLSGVDYVFHLISTTTPAVSDKDPFIDIDTNVRGSVQLFELCIQKGVKRVIFPSSGGAVYGDPVDGAFSETMVPLPLSPYGIGKLTVEHYLRYFKHTKGLDYIAYRIGNPYGPGQNIYGKQGIIPIFMHKFLIGEPVTFYGDGSMVRDYIYIEDLIRMITASYDQPHHYTEYNLGSGRGYSVQDIYNNMEACTNIKVAVNHLPVPATFVSRSILNIERFESEFGKQHFTSLRDGLESTWEYVKNLK